MACHGKIARLPGPVRVPTRTPAYQRVLPRQRNPRLVELVARSQIGLRRPVPGPPRHPAKPLRLAPGPLPGVARPPGHIWPQAEEVAAPPRRTWQPSPRLAPSPTISPAPLLSVMPPSSPARAPNWTKKALRELRALRPICQVAVRLRSQTTTAPPAFGSRAGRWEVGRQGELAAQAERRAATTKERKPPSPTCRHSKRPARLAKPRRLQRPRRPTRQPRCRLGQIQPPALKLAWRQALRPPAPPNSPPPCPPKPPGEAESNAKSKDAHLDTAPMPVSDSPRPAQRGEG